LVQAALCAVLQTNLHSASRNPAIGNLTESIFESMNYFAVLAFSLYRRKL